MTKGNTMSKTIEQLFAELQGSSTIFSVTTRRKNNKIVDGVLVEPAGAIYTSTYRLGVPATKKAAARRLAKGVRAESDAANNVITVYDMQKKDNNGNRGAFRRLNLNGVERIKAGGIEYVVEHDGNKWVAVEV